MRGSTGGTLARRAGDPELARVDRLELVCMEARRNTDEGLVAGCGRQRSRQMDTGQREHKVRITGTQRV